MKDKTELLVRKIEKDIIESIRKSLVDEVFIGLKPLIEGSLQDIGETWVPMSEVCKEFVKEAYGAISFGEQKTPDNVLVYISLPERFSFAEGSKKYGDGTYLNLTKLINDFVEDGPGNEEFAALVLALDRMSKAAWEAWRKTEDEPPEHYVKDWEGR